jgi:hypothetical protein
MPRHALWVAAAFALAALPASPDTSGRSDFDVIGHWTFDRGDARGSGGSLDGVVKGAAFKDGCAVFDGTSAIEVPVRAGDLRRGYRRIEIEARFELDTNDRYYATVFSHPLFTVAVHALGSGKARPCFTFANVISELAPEQGGDGRWGKGPALTAATDKPFFYWGWIGDGATVIPAKTWVTLRTTYDGKSVTQHIDGKLVATHGLRTKDARVFRDANQDGKALIGRYVQDVGTDTALAGRIDYVRVRAAR